MSHISRSSLRLLVLVLLPGKSLITTVLYLIGRGVLLHFVFWLVLFPWPLIHAGMIIGNSSPGLTLFPFGEVNVCPGGTRVFTCQVSMAATSPPTALPQIHWRIQFETGLSDIHQSYVVSDPVGEVLTNYRSPGYTFTFNLTSSGALHLESTLTVTLDANHSTNYNEASASVILHLTTGTSVLNLIRFMRDPDPW